MRNKINELRDNHASKNHLNDDRPMCERHEANYIQSGGYHNRNSHDLFSRKSHHDPNDSEKSLTELNNDVKNDLEDFKRRIRSMRTDYDKLYDIDDHKTTGVLPNKKSKTVNQEPQPKTDLEKSITKFLDGQRVTNMFFKNNVNDMVLKMKQNEKNFQTIFKNMERKMDEWEKSQNISSEHTDRTDPPPPQAHTEHVNVVFTGSGKSDDSLKIQTLPPIIVEDKPIKTSIKSKKIDLLKHQIRDITRSKQMNILSVRSRSNDSEAPIAHNSEHIYLTDYEEIDRGYVAYFERTSKEENQQEEKDHLDKFDGKADEGFFVGYSLNSKAFRVFNSRTRIVEENLHIRFSESTPNDVGQARKETEPVKNYILLPLWTADPPYSQDPKSSHDDGSKPSSDDRKKVDEDPRKESECKDQETEDNVNSTNNVNTVSSTVNVAGTNKVNAVGGKTSIELRFDSNMHALEDYSIFDFSRDDKDDGVVADINNWDTTIQVSPNPTTRIHKDHPLDQVIGDLKSATQTRKMSKNLKEHGEEPNKIEKEVYICQPPGFKDPDFPDRVHKVEKARYGLHQAPRAWHKGDILLVQVYVDDIIFGSTKKELYNAFAKLMHEKFQMSSIGEKFGFSEVKTTSTPMETQKPLLKDEDGEEVDVHMYRSMIGSLMYPTSSKPDIMFAVCACARYQVIPKVSHLHAVKRIFRYLKGQPKLGLWYPKDSLFDLVAYTHSDYAGASLDRKSTTGGCQFLGCRLISWQCKKQTVVANSTTEAEYVAASS
ncbi:uncharacterized mitochondrial protein-like protein [Tanacetum coccineum]